MTGVVVAKASAASTVVGFIILIALVVGAVWGVRALVRRRQAWNALTPDEQEHRRAIRAADKGVKGANRDYKKAVGSVRSELERAVKPVKLGSFNGVVLTDENIKTQSGVHPLTPNVTAAADSAGGLTKTHSSRSTLTRMGAGTLVAGPLGLLAGAAAKKGKTQTVDTRELYLLIEGGEWADLIKCNPDHGDKARGFAQQINVAARNVERVRTERKRRVAEIRERLVTVEADRSSIEAAEDARAQLGDGPSDPVLNPPSHET